MPPNARTWRRIDVLSFVALLATTACVGHYLMSDLQSGLHSDSALKSVLAAVALDEHRLVPHGWTFANGDILTTTPYALLVPLQGFFGMSFATNAAASLLCLLAMAGALYALARTISTGPRAQAFVACALATSALSSANLEFIAAQGAYSLYATLALLLFALLLRPASGIARWMPALLAFTLVVSNPKRAWVMVLAPAMLAHVAAVLTGAYQRAPGLRGRLSALLSPPLLSMTAGAIGGHFLYLLFIVPTLQNFDAVARVTPASIERMLHVAQQLPGDWFRYFQIEGAWASLSIPMRILQLGVWLVACLVPLAPGLVLLSKRSSPNLKYAAWLTYALLASGLLPLIVLDGLYQGAMEIRYATLGILVGLTVLPAWVYQIREDGPRRLFVWTTGLSLVVATATSFAWHSKFTPATPDVHGVSLQQRMALIDTLRAQRVGTAIATYWNSHVLSVLSSGTVMVSPVSYNDRLAPFAHHVPNIPLHGSAGPMEAVILEDAELALDGGAAIIEQVGEPKSKLRTGHFNVWLYEAGTISRIFAVGHRFDEAVPPARVAIESSAAVPACGANDCVVRLHVQNTGQLTLATAGDVPMRIGLRGLDKGGQMLADLGRADFQIPLQPGESDDLMSRIGKLPDGVVSIQACLLQEQVQWLCERTSLGDDPSLVALDRPVDPSSVDVLLSGAGLAACEASEDGGCRADLTIRNKGKFALNGPGSMPLVIGYRARRPASSGGGIVEGRIALPQPLGAGAEVTVPVVLAAADAGLDFQVCVLQEHVAWLCDRTAFGDTSPMKLDQPVDPSLVQVVLSGAGFTACTSNRSTECRSSLTVRNAGQVTVNGPGSKPLVIGYRAHRPASAGGGIAEGRVALPHPLGPGVEVTVPVSLDAREAGLDFQVCVLQEHVAWLCEKTSSRTPPIAPLPGK